MPKLSEIIKTTTLLLPESGATVTVYDKIAYEKAQMLRETASTEESKLQIGIVAALEIIESWDITDDNGIGLTVSRDVLLQLPDADVTKIANYAIELITKQNTPKDTAPVEEVAPPAPATDQVVVQGDVE